MNPKIVIPENAIDLINEAINKSTLLKLEIEDCFDFELDENEEKNRRKLKRKLFKCMPNINAFFEYILLFPNLWTNINIFQYCFRGLAQENPVFYFVFSSIKNDENIIVSIPKYLYGIYIDIFKDKNPDDMWSTKGLRFAQKLCDIFLLGFTRFLVIVDAQLKIQKNGKAPISKSTYKVNISKGKIKVITKPRIINIKPMLTDNGRILHCKRGTFDFTKRQAIIIEIYFNNYEEGNDYLSEQNALNLADSIMRDENPDKNYGYSETSFKNMFKSEKYANAFKAIFEQHPNQRDLWRLNID